jgi:MoxR-like ATPase
MKDNNNGELNNKVTPAYLALLRQASEDRYKNQMKMDRVDANIPSNDAEEIKRARNEKILKKYGYESSNKGGDQTTIVSEILTTNDLSNLSQEDKDKYVSESMARLYSSMRVDRALKVKADLLNNDLKKIIKAGIDNGKTNKETIGNSRNIEAEIKENSDNLFNLQFSSPEAFLSEQLTKLKEFKKQFNENDIVITDTIKAKKEEISNTLAKNGMVALVGETGTGKTKFAKLMTEESHESTHGQPLIEGDSPYLFLAAHSMMTRDELLEHVGLKAEGTNVEFVPDKIDMAVLNYREAHPDYTPEQLDEAEQSIKQAIITQAGKQVETIVVEGIVDKARREGKVLIIDEFNYMNPGLLASLNEALASHKEAKIGFGVIFTGNITMSGIERYGSRQGLDPAFLNRLNSGLVIWETPRQEDIDKTLNNSIVSDNSRKEGDRQVSRELYQIGLSILADIKGNVYGPEDMLEQTWKFTQAVKIFQDNFAGKTLREEFHNNPTGTNSSEFRLKNSHVSMRTFTQILETWKAEQFSKPLDWYLYNKVIKPNMITSPDEAGYYYQILKERYGFFTDENWNWLSRDGNGKLIGNRPDVWNGDRPNVKLFSVQEVSEAFSGYQMPQEWVGNENNGEKISEEKLRNIFSENEALLEKFTNKMENLKKVMESVCAESGEGGSMDFSKVMESQNFKDLSKLHQEFVK